MSDLKRKRSPEHPCSARMASSEDRSYLAGLPEGLEELADVHLLVEGQALPVHTYVLRKSPILLAAVAAASNEKQRVCQVPLPTETRKDVLLVLKYLYMDAPKIQAKGHVPVQAMAKFAHKYNLAELHTMSQKVLMEIPFSNAAFNVFDRAHFAEQGEMGMLLAQCERFIILHFHSMSTADKKLQKLSQASLLRIMNGLAGRDAGDIEWETPDPNGVAIRSAIFLCSRCHKWTETECCQCGHYGYQYGHRSESRKVNTISRQVVRASSQAMAPSEEQLVQQQKSLV